MKGRTINNRLREAVPLVVGDNQLLEGRKLKREGFKEPVVKLTSANGLFCEWRLPTVNRVCTANG